MALRRDKVLVVDIEATCWEADPPPDGQVNEIIEIGLCIYDVQSDQIGGKRSILVKPVASEISPFCTQLTTITPEQVEKHGTDFATACRILVEEYHARKTLWASWGGYDQKIFRKQCRRMGVSYPFGDKHMNLRRIFADNNAGRRIGMIRALDLAGLTLQGTHHRGHDDAWNIANLMRHLVHEQGIDFIKRFW